jgi:hypothetical protein
MLVRSPSHALGLGRQIPLVRILIFERPSLPSCVCAPPSKRLGNCEAQAARRIKNANLPSCSKVD